ncbi:MAG TPA: phosphoribosylformylglycinamidine synthase I [Planctomycetota bacterium]|nr:phosphoribosylformylglycinamidine synthase I [Planctomycetota bacterium]
MSAPRVLILRAPGTNCDEETAFAFEKAGGQCLLVHIRALRASPAMLMEHAILALPGGFSYGDDLGSGTVIGNELMQHLAEPLQRFVERGGLALGICNGFQILVKTGLLPGLSYLNAEGGRREEGGEKTNENSAPSAPLPPPSSLLPLPAATLTFNESQHFEDRWIHLKIEPSTSPFLEGHAGQLVEFPVAHGEGRFVARDADALRRIEEGKQVAFRYVTAEGAMPAYPENPNGAQNHIAGITDETGRVLGLMPHPERHVLPWQHPRWTRGGLKKEGDGLFLFRNAIKHAKG